MATEFEFSMRIDFYRDAPESLSIGDAGRVGDRAGSMTKEGVRAACVPRVGERVLPLSSYLPHPHAAITAVEHNLAGVRLADDGETERSASVTVVVSAPWPGDELREVLVRDFEDRGWTWRETEGLRAV